jgi:hypothetical protein
MPSLNIKVLVIGLVAFSAIVAAVVVGIWVQSANQVVNVPTPTPPKSVFPVVTSTPSPIVERPVATPLATPTATLTPVITPTPTPKPTPYPPGELPFPSPTSRPRLPDRRA